MKEESSKYLAKQFQGVSGISPNAPDSARPVSGYLVNKSQIDKKRANVKKLGGNTDADAIYEIEDQDVFGDGLTAQGEIEVILRPEVSGRTSYIKGDPLLSGGRPVSMNSADNDDIVDAVINSDGDDKKQRMTKAVLEILKGYAKDDFSSVNRTKAAQNEKEIDSHEHFEALVSGGFSKNDIEGIHYPYSKVHQMAKYVDISDVINEAIIRSRAQNLKISPMQMNMMYDDIEDMVKNMKSADQLRDYRAAQKVKQTYENAGIGYVKFAHPLGFNIENPRYYDETATGYERVEEVIKKNIFKEIDEIIQKVAKDFYKQSRKQQ